MPTNDPVLTAWPTTLSPSVSNSTTTTCTTNLSQNGNTTAFTFGPIPTISPATSHFVDVGADGDLRFNPNGVNAAVGDWVFFRFLQLNHTVTQSTLDQPCSPAGGYDTGFNFNPLNQTGVINQIVPFLVRDSEPAFFFCRQTVPESHCAAGMVFAINAGQKLSLFIDNARSSPALNGSYSYNRRNLAPNGKRQPSYPFLNSSFTYPPCVANPTASLLFPINFTANRTQLPVPTAVSSSGIKISGRMNFALLVGLAGFLA